MIATPEIVLTTAEPAAVIRLTIPRSEMMKQFGPAVGELMATLARQGVAPDGAAIDTPMERFDQVLDVNLRGAYAVATAAARVWREDRRGG